MENRNAVPHQRPFLAKPSLQGEEEEYLNMIIVTQDRLVPEYSSHSMLDDRGERIICFSFLLHSKRAGKAFQQKSPDRILVTQRSISYVCRR